MESSKNASDEDIPQEDYFSCEQAPTDSDKNGSDREPSSMECDDGYVEDDIETNGEASQKSEEVKSAAENTEEQVQKLNDLLEKTHQFVKLLAGNLKSRKIESKCNSQINTTNSEKNCDTIIPTSESGEDPLNNTNVPDKGQDASITDSNLKGETQTSSCRCGNRDCESCRTKLPTVVTGIKRELQPSAEGNDPKKLKLETGGASLGTSGEKKMEDSRELDLSPSGSAGKTTTSSTDGRNLDEDSRNTVYSLSESLPTAKVSQPNCITGGTMKNYQLQGLTWLVSLFENGVNGILADEMGLGKTLQVISFIGHLRERGIYFPFLVIAPLSSLYSWLEEFGKWYPSMPVVLYHGTKDERGNMAREYLSYEAILREGKNFPVILTSFEIAMNDKNHLQKIFWKLVVVDEGHRLKNHMCKLLKDLKLLRTKSLFLLTGTPIQNNLYELWSLMNFIMPELFKDVDGFKHVFRMFKIGDESENKRIILEEQRNKIVTKLHQILQPFLLRREKSIIEDLMPNKEEKIVYVKMTPNQEEVYKSILDRSISKNYSEISLQNTLMQLRKCCNHVELFNKNMSERMLKEFEEHHKAVEDEQKKLQEAKLGLEFNKRKKDAPFVYDQSFIQNSTQSLLQTTNPNPTQTNTTTFQTCQTIPQPTITTNTSTAATDTTHTDSPDLQYQRRTEYMVLKAKQKTLYEINQNRMKLVANWINGSGKMILLDRLLRQLYKRKHKVLIFSQMTRMLDIIEHYLCLINYQYCRIDGSLSWKDRQQEMKDFNNKKVFCFLLSTRAGGLGLNLAKANRVILFDSDWNPHADIQAQDRCHRIGQDTKVVVYRLLTANSIEMKIWERASNKLKLDQLVIQNKNFENKVDPFQADSSISLTELKSLLDSKMAGDNVDFYTDSQLSKLAQGK